jgi:hypothetical protein
MIGSAAMNRPAAVIRSAKVNRPAAFDIISLYSLSEGERPSIHLGPLASRSASWRTFRSESIPIAISYYKTRV